MDSDPRRNLPSVDSLTGALGPRPEPPGYLTEAARVLLSRVRNESSPTSRVPNTEDLASELIRELEAAARPSLRRVINASGVLLQTNLGRAPLSRNALAAMAEVAAASNLEYDLAEGSRGSRHEHLRNLISQTTGAEDGIAVNNNAAALFMVLQAFCQGREVIVSRGQAVEIGGGFRIPDVIRQSGARLIEVGTTNRTYARDYEAAIGPETAAILRVHASSFRVTGFTAEPSAAELVAIARSHSILSIDDLGSGCLVKTEDYGLGHELTVQESLGAGMDLALFSGDKLLGGPQAGIIAGRGTLVAELRRHPLARALRLDKIAIAALNATLYSYLMQRQDDEIPVWQMLRRDTSGLRRRARKWARSAGEAGAVIGSTTMVGGGALPGQSVPTFCATLRAPWGATETARRLRNGRIPIVGRVQDETVLLDPRTVEPADDHIVGAAIRTLFEQPTDA